LNCLNQDADCLKESGLWDEVNKTYVRMEKAVQSVKFSLGSKSTPYATSIALAIKGDPFLGGFQFYNPNAWCKRSCDPQFTDISHKCRGDKDTCEILEKDNFDEDGKPTAKSCWRTAFRWHLHESKETKGFMVQVQEVGGLGKGQEIETEMAALENVKVFRTYTDDEYFHPNAIKSLSEAVEAWYVTDCKNLMVETVYLDSKECKRKVNGKKFCWGFRRHLA